MYSLIDLYNLFCATCCQLDPALPLLYYSKGGVSYPEPDDDLVAKLHDLAFDNLVTYRQLTQATDLQDQQYLRLEIVDLLWRECAEYMQ